MSDFRFDHIRFAGIASAVPTRIVKSEEFISTFGEDAVRKFVEKTGVTERRIALEHQTASDLGYAAAEKLIAEKQINRDEIGVLIFGSHCGDYRKPATAAVLHKRLKLNQECAAFDVGLGCSAFVYSAQVAASMLMSSACRYALVVVGETPTRYVSPEDRSQAMLGGDGGSALLLEKTEEINRFSGKLCTYGEGYRSVIVPAGGFRNPNESNEPMMWADGYPRTLYQTYMNGMDVFTFTMTRVPKSIKQFLADTEQTIDQFDCLAFHQANVMILQQLSKKLKVPGERIWQCMDRYGNTVSASIPLLLSDLYGTSGEKKEINTLMCGFGIGLSWGVMSAVISTEDILPVIETDEYFAEGIIHSPQDLE